MSQKYYTILTEKGAALLANATALGVPLKLSQMAVGDGNGTMPNPIASQTKLVNEVRRAAINTISIDENNQNQIIAEQVIPENEGGWFIHEIGLFDDKDNLIAVGNCPATYKPKLAEGSGRTQVIRMIIIVDNADSVAIKIDPSVVLATREYVEKSLSSHNTTAKQNFDSEIKKLVPNTRKINNKELKSDLNLIADDVNALPAKKTITNGLPIYEVGDILKLLNVVDFSVLPTLKKQNVIGNGVLSKNGYAQIPLFIAGKIQNLIVQWGEGNTDATGRALVTLPVSNPTATLFATAVERDARAWFSSNSWATTWGISAKESTNSQITICTKGVIDGRVVTGSYAYSYLTIGY